MLKNNTPKELPILGYGKEQQIRMVTEGDGYFALLCYDEIRHLEGRMLTLIDASFVDREQREAMKSLIRNEVWHWSDNLMYKNWFALEPGNCQGSSK